MSDEEKIITIGLYFEIKDSKLYGGIGSVGYANTYIDLPLEIITGETVGKYVESNICGLSNLCGVSADKVRLIQRTEYEENTEDDDPEDEYDE